jgi:hypothetical protein
MALLGQKTWNDYEFKKRLFVQNVEHIGLVVTFFEELVDDESLQELATSFNHTLSDLISNTRKKLQDRFKILASRSIETRSTKSKRS